MGFKLSQRSLDKMIGVNPKLVEVVKLAITKSPLDFSISEGLRTVERQKELVAQKKSQTMKSRHIVGEAVDICTLFSKLYSLYVTTRLSSNCITISYKLM